MILNHGVVAILSLVNKTLSKSLMQSEMYSSCFKNAQSSARQADNFVCSMSAL